MLSVVGSLVGVYIMIQAYWRAPTEQALANCSVMATACALVLILSRTGCGGGY